jgi:hypothetical protein
MIYKSQDQDFGKLLQTQFDLQKPVPQRHDLADVMTSYNDFLLFD